MTFSYLVYGLRLDSTFEVPGLVARPSTHPPDCLLRFAPLDALDRDSLTVIYEGSRDGDPSMRVVRDDSRILFSFQDGTEILVADRGRNITAHWSAPATADDLATYLLSPVLASVLRLRSTLSLHASAVSIGDRAIAIAAPAGGGKSTTAAVFADRGRAVLTDDVLAIDWRDDEPWALPGYPRVRLWWDVVEARYGHYDALPLLTPTWTKQYLDLTTDGRRFASEPLPLAAIFVLQPRGEAPPSIEALHGHAAVMAVVANTSMSALLDAPSRAAELDEVVRFVEKVPVFAVNTGPLAQLDEVCASIEQAAAIIPRP